MAFAKQFFSSYKSNNNLDYYLEIWVDGFDSSATEISVGAGGPVISYETDQEDRFSPILSSQCVLPFVVKNTSLQAFIQLLRTTYQERQVYLHLYRATSSTYTTTKPIWSGFLVMDLGSGEDVSFPYEQKLTFVDGLSLLKDIDFVDLSNAGSETNIQGSYTQDNMYFGPAIYTFWIKEILAKAGVATTTKGVSIDYGFTTAVNWYNADMQNTNQGSDPLGLTQCIVSMFHTKNDQDVFTPENCYTVLKELLRHWGARITYWKHEFWIVQIPEYIQDESGLIDNPDNINSRQYNRFGTLLGSQDHLGDTYYTRYEQTIQSNQVSKLVGTKYNYLPMIHNAEADFLSFASKNYYGGFPYGITAESQEIFQGTIVDPSTANFLWLSVPLNWVWDMTLAGSTTVDLSNGHTDGWWCSVKFNFYASDGTTTYYLQYDSSNGSYYWVLEADWSPLGNTSPRYVIKSKSLTETNYIGFQEQIPFVDSSGSTITMSGAWSFFFDIEDYGTSSSNPGSFYCNFSGYNNPTKMRNPQTNITIITQLGLPVKSGTVSWSNSLQDPTAIAVPSTILNPAGFNAGTSQADIRLVTQSSFKGFLQTLNTTQSASFGLSLNSQINNSTNTETFNFGTLLWGDAIQQFAIGCLRVNNGSAFVKTNPAGEWGRGTLTGNNTFTELLIDEFLSGQIKVVIAPTMRLAVGEENKNQTATGTGGPATRPRYVNPIGRLREFRSNETDPEYIFRRGSFHSLYDEWDYEGYQILRDTVSATTTTTDIGDIGGPQDNGPISNAKIIGNVTNALMMNSPVAYVRATVPATGSNVSVNGNFNTAVGWTLGTGWSIDTTAKKAKFAATGSTSELTQSVLTQGLTYQINFKVVVTAGTLLVKAGSSGTSQSITTSGDYSIYLNCEGSNLIKFQAGTTFTGNITYITLRDQKSISSVPINSIGSTVFKANDTFNLINSIGDEILPLTVTSNQGATDETISVTSTALYDDIGIDSVLLINQDDLSAQYQNKTKGTIAGFGIDADGISKGGIEITGWLNSDTMSGAAVTNVPTALSVKNYVDGQVGASDTLAEVLANGNTTGGTDIVVSSGDKIIGPSVFEIYSEYGNRGRITLLSSTSALTTMQINFLTSGTLKAAITRQGSFLINTTTDTGEKLQVDGTSKFTGQVTIPATPVALTDAASKGYVDAHGGGLGPFLPLTGGTLTGSLTGTTATFSGNLELSNGTLNSTTARLSLKSEGSYVHLKSNNNVIYYDATSHLFRDNSGSEKMRLTTNGLLIGTTTDSGAKLSIQTPTAGTALLELNYTSGNSFQFQNGIANVTVDALLIKDVTNNRNYITLRGDNVGINQVNPTEKLHVVGDALITGDSHADAFKPAATGEPIKFKNFGSTELARITDGGNVLIGTTTDSGAKLTVASSSFSSVVLSCNYSSSNQNNFFEAGIDLNDGYIKLKNSGVVETIKLNSDGNSYFNGGNLGINTSSPSEKLHVVGKGIFTDQVTIPATPVASTDAASKGYVDAQVSATDSLQEVTTVGNTTTNNVMIGSSSAPASTLHVKGSNSGASAVASGTLIVEQGSAPSIQILSANSQQQNIKFGDPQDGDVGRITYSHPSNYMSFTTNASERMRLTSAGNLLIGTTTDSGAKLNVQGSLQVGVDDTGYDVTFYGDTSGRDMSWNASQNRLELHDSVQARFGTAGSLRIQHNGSNGLIDNYNGHITITNSSNNSDIILSSDDGGGGITSYITLDGSQTTINLQQSVLIGTTTNSGVYKLDVFGKARVQSVFELDDVLTLNQISTPADPASGKSSIFMDSADGAIKVKINVGGTVVTRTIASFE